jgi:hypothetical protein
MDKKQFPNRTENETVIEDGGQRDRKDPDNTPSVETLKQCLGFLVAELGRAMGDDWPQAILGCEAVEKFAKEYEVLVDQAPTSIEGGAAKSWYVRIEER